MSRGTRPSPRAALEGHPHASQHHRSLRGWPSRSCLSCWPAGRAGEDATSTAASQATTTSATVAPTTTVPPMTAEELAWLRAVTRLHKGIDKVIHQSATLTRAKMTSDANTLRACSRELARIGSPSDRLQPVYVIVKKACADLRRGCEMLGHGRERQHGGRRGHRRHPRGADAAAGDRLRRCMRGTEATFSSMLSQRARRSRPSSGDVVVSGDRSAGVASLDGAFQFG